MTQKQIWIINITISIIFTFLIVYFKDDIHYLIERFLNRINKPLAIFSTDPFDILIISLIPIWSYFLYSSKIDISLKNLVLANLTILISIFSSCFIAFLLADNLMKPESPFIPSYIVFVPFPYVFWKLICIIGIVIPIIIKRKFFSSLKNNEKLDNN